LKRASRKIGGITKVKSEAGASTQLNIASYLPVLKPNSEYHIQISFLLPETQPWAEKGFVVASNQLEIKAKIKETVSLKSSLKVDDEQKKVIVSDKNFKLSFSKESGALSSYLLNGKEQISAPLLPHFSRPLTDNDRRGWKPQRKMKEWYNVQLKVKEIKTEKSDKGVLVKTNYSLVGDSANVTIQYLINPQGVVKVTYHFSPKFKLPNLPKVGMQMGIRREFEQITWFGRGQWKTIPINAKEWMWVSIHKLFRSLWKTMWYLKKMVIVPMFAGCFWAINNKQVCW
jgi:beta-galactosidase